MPLIRGIILLPVVPTLGLLGPARGVTIVIYHSDVPRLLWSHAGQGRPLAISPPPRSPACIYPVQNPVSKKLLIVLLQAVD